METGAACHRMQAYRIQYTSNLSRFSDAGFSRSTVSCHVRSRLLNILSHITSSKTMPIAWTSTRFVGVCALLCCVVSCRYTANIVQPHRTCSRIFSHAMNGASQATVLISKRFSHRNRLIKNHFSIAHAQTAYSTDEYSIQIAWTHKFP